MDVEAEREQLIKFDPPEQEYCTRLLDEIDRLQAELATYKAGNVPVTQIIADNEHLVAELEDAKTACLLEIDDENKRLRAALERVVSDQNAKGISESELSCMAEQALKQTGEVEG